MRHCTVGVGGIGVDSGEIDVDVGGIAVGVGGIGVDVGKTGEGVGGPDKLHPNTSGRANPTHQTCCTRFLGFIRTSSNG